MLNGAAPVMKVAPQGDAWRALGFGHEVVALGACLLPDMSRAGAGSAGYGELGRRQAAPERKSDCDRCAHTLRINATQGHRMSAFTYFSCAYLRMGVSNQLNKLIGTRTDQRGFSPNYSAARG
jgi:hypothetical protein